jgi:hypothetical protein
VASAWSVGLSGSTTGTGRTEGARLRVATRGGGGSVRAASRDDPRRPCQNRHVPGSRYAALVAITACLLAVLAGCGNSRTPVPSLTTPAPPSGFRPLRFPAAGLSLQAPRNWNVTAGHGRLLTTVSSGGAVVALWRFPVSGPAPVGDAALRQAAQQLVSAARARDPGMRVIASKVARIGGIPAVELDAVEQIAGHSRRVRSSHLFEPHAEVVLEEYAPPGLFAGVEAAVFLPLMRSLLVTRA